MRGHLLVTGAMLAAMVAVAAPASALVGDCSYDGAANRLDVDLSGEGHAELTRDGTHIVVLVDGVDCDPGATVPTTSNVDRVVIDGGAGAQNLLIDLTGGRFAPGATDEPGSTDEIEIVVRLGTEIDIVTVTATGGPDRIRIGSDVEVPTNHEVNLNATEADGVDTDLSLRGTEWLMVRGGSGDDVIRGNGGVGTGGPAQVAMFLDGDSGSDTLLGGSYYQDRLVGGLGPDDMGGGGGAADVVRYDQEAFRTRGVRVRLDDLANDGDPFANRGLGEGDRIRDDVEGVVGSTFNDELIGNAAPNHLWGQGGVDVLRGGGGSDFLGGGEGNDHLYGGPGQDQIAGGYGDDDHYAQDGEVDTVNGGPGSLDTCDCDEDDDVVGVP